MRRVSIVADVVVVDEWWYLDHTDIADLMMNGEDGRAVFAYGIFDEEVGAGGEQESKQKRAKLCWVPFSFFPLLRLDWPEHPSVWVFFPVFKSVSHNVNLSPTPQTPPRRGGGYISASDNLRYQVVGEV